jgi:hypothetical protein
MVQSKVNRATEHYADLKARIDAWFASEPYRVESVIAEDRLGCRMGHSARGLSPQPS